MSRRSVTEGPRVDELSQAHKALLVLDIDEVVLEFIAPFQELLAEYGARLQADSFRLTGNVRSLSTGAALSGSELDQVTMRLYEDQEARQKVVQGAAESLGRLAGMADIVFLTAMTPSFYPRRRTLLDREGLTFPMIATERSKGAVVAELGARWDGPLIFADDLPPNLVSVQRSYPAAHLIHLMANEAFRPHLPPLPNGALAAADWGEAESLILAILDGKPARTRGAA
ncbi:hypothetical protein [Aurantimonas endophytica]|uniref:Uncharacterized protein n=1 Tax=Aurantimonas endophytica TaxID=1522175 RepID=A0A7W6HB69_9HYPH|nr:hypothetical protein [Aurantimonas endophytica]MBB4001693.1 hypothetical protein [Aurantimonas endophytica]MCO6402670.1 hypothetical protein [Aurantimonas endophytica]